MSLSPGAKIKPTITSLPKYCDHVRTVCPAHQVRPSKISICHQRTSTRELGNNNLPFVQTTCIRGRLWVWWDIHSLWVIFIAKEHIHSYMFMNHIHSSAVLFQCKLSGCRFNDHGMVTPSTISLVPRPLIQHVYRLQHNVWKNVRYWKRSALGLVWGLGPRLIHYINCMHSSTNKCLRHIKPTPHVSMYSLSATHLCRKGSECSGTAQFHEAVLLLVSEGG